MAAAEPSGFDLIPLLTSSPHWLVALGFAAVIVYSGAPVWKAVARRWANSVQARTAESEGAKGDGISAALASMVAAQQAGSEATRRLHDNINSLRATEVKAMNDGLASALSGLDQLLKNEDQEREEMRDLREKVLELWLRARGAGGNGGGHG